jgi:hypothetical protein
LHLDQNVDSIIGAFVAPFPSSVAPTATHPQDVVQDTPDSVLTCCGPGGLGVFSIVHARPFQLSARVTPAPEEPM